METTDKMYLRIWHTVEQGSKYSNEKWFPGQSDWLFLIKDVTMPFKRRYVFHKSGRLAVEVKTNSCGFSWFNS